MRGAKKDKRTLMVRIVCGLLAFLMVASVLLSIFL